VISRARLRPTCGQGSQPGFTPHPRPADDRGPGKEESS
jgi:hypothetical protein